MVKHLTTASFIKRIAAAAQAAMKKYGILASLTIAQSALESGWGTHAPGNNLFGIKSHGWSGPTQILKTAEFINGRTITVRDVFRVYKSWDESLNDHTLFLTRNSRYSNLIGVGDYNKACTLIQQDGYATEENYAKSLIELIKKYKLFNYDKLPTEIKIDSPVNASTLAGNITVKGWALCTGGIKRVDVYYDSKKGVTSIHGFSERHDVIKSKNQFDWYKGAQNCGFETCIHVGKIPAGKHTLNIAVIGNDGSTTWAKCNINVIIPPLITIDSPENGDIVSDDIFVKGWAVNVSGIKRVDVYIDGQTGVASIKNFSARPDVEKTINPYGRYKGAEQSGFKYVITKGKVAPGRHEVSCAAIGNNGTVCWAHKPFTVQ